MSDDKTIRTPLTDEQLTEAVKRAPKEALEIIKDERFGPLIQAIGKDYGLSPTQCLYIEDEVVYLLLELKDINTFQEDIAKKLRIPSEIARRIANDVKESMFADDDTTPSTQNNKKKVPPPPPPPTTTSSTNQNTPTGVKTQISKTTAPHPFEQKLKDLSAPKNLPVQTPAQGQPRQDPYREPIDIME